jgi:hypothetical protein
MTTMNSLKPILGLLFLVWMSTHSGFAQAQELERLLVIENHRFVPSELRVPAGKKIRLLVENRDSTAEEFESHDLNREKLIAPKSRVTIFIGPLKPGRYAFMGEFHADTATGTVIAED